MFISNSNQSNKTQIIFFHAKSFSHMAASSVVNSVPQHQVFLNFRGEELRHTFISHLENALRDKNINIFIDSKAAKGQHLDILFKEIEGSRIALAIFSKGYTESEWCLNELVKIRERMDQGNLVTIPIFYIVEPKTVKHQEGVFGDELRKKKRKVGDDQVNKWVGALKSVSDRLGFPFDGKRYNCLPASFKSYDI